MLLVSGFILRYIIFGIAMFLAIRAGFLEMVLCMIGVFVGKWVMLLFWLYKSRFFLNVFGKG